MTSPLPRRKPQAMDVDRELVGHGSLPCLACGRDLDAAQAAAEPYDARRVCRCGVTYAELGLNDYRDPWRRRAWLRLLACTCGQVRRVGREIIVTRHVCRDGHVVA